MKKTICVHNEKCPVTLMSGVIYSQSLDNKGQLQKPLALHFIRPSVWYTTHELTHGIPPKEKLPTIIWISGGGFQTTAPLRFALEFNYLVERGYQIASIDYRVSGEATFPAAVQDAKTAVRFLKANADKYGVDEKRIAVMGESAGGYLAAMIGVTSEIDVFDTDEWSGYDSSVKAVVDLYGPTDLMLMERKPLPIYQGNMLTPIRKFLGDRGMNDEHLQKLANPMNHISDKTPPFLMMHGTDDQMVSCEQSEILYEALLEQGVSADFYTLEGANHAGNEFWQEPIKHIIGRFFETYL